MLTVLAGLALVIVGISTQLLIIGAAGFLLSCAGAYRISGHLGRQASPGIPRRIPPRNP
ncbi:hypothetical protein D477_007009 [Arthrobacter crystallopoietes BAB-32]|uniref:Uncharacterized protein n=1 Tax=Arthrobacter crystallopoietes BAB-32 TaxID=1246476 RepID=N1UX10_9MICC|nr:hypothetical protein D477_007009 [Arthrobacter crystallopoietes BAB-32]